MSAIERQANASALESNYASEIDDALQFLKDCLSSASHPIASTKFSPDSAVFLHLLTSVCPKIPIIWVDTGYNTRDSIRYVEYLQSTLDLNLKTYRPANLNPPIAPELGTPAHDAFTYATKLEPFHQALKELEPDLWLSSLRRYQSAHRSTLAKQEAISSGLSKCYPMLDWSPAAVDAYRRVFNLPIGPDVYDPTKGLPLRECGLHTKLWSAADSQVSR
ncbi:MAG: phosphoadenosine phosphosulfate reductase family protein [Granulosicoccus sp.]